MPDLFSKPLNWRAPSRPREQPCQVCGTAAPCGTGVAWFCVQCVPEGFWPAESRARRGFAPDVGDVL